jgi:hypothetical protein
VASDLAVLIAEAIKKARDAKAQAALEQAGQLASKVQNRSPQPPPPPAPAAPPAAAAPSAGTIARAQAAAASDAAAAAEQAELDALSNPAPVASLPGLPGSPAPSSARLLRAFGGGAALLSGIVLSEALAPPIALRRPGSASHE